MTSKWSLLYFCLCLAACSANASKEDGATDLEVAPQDVVAETHADTYRASDLVTETHADSDHASDLVETSIFDSGGEDLLTTPDVEDALQLADAMESADLPVDGPADLVPDIAPDTVPAWECSAAPEVPACDEDGPPVHVTGNALIFGPPWGYVEYVPVTVVELPGVVALTNDYGDFTFENLPPCQEVTFRIEAEGFRTTHTETFTTATEPLDQVAFQVPTLELYDLIATTIGGEPGLETCNLGGTVSVKEMSLDSYLVPHGVEGADVTVCPYPGDGHGPIYFEYITDALILPDIGLEQTSVDGGYIFKGLPAGDYVVQAHKDGVDFRSARIRCEPGLFINAAPPMGLHELEPPSVPITPVPLWAGRYGGPGNDDVGDIAVGEDGTFFLVGFFDGDSLDLGCEPMIREGESDNMFLARFDASGQCQWSKRYTLWQGNQLADDAFSLELALTESDNLVVSGTYKNSNLDFGGGPLGWAGKCCDIWLCPGCPCEDTFVARFSPDGEHQWSIRLGGCDQDRSRALAVDESDNIWLTGQSWSPTVAAGDLNTGGQRGDGSLFVAKLSADGQPLWINKFSGSGAVEAYELVPGPGALMHLAGNLLSGTAKLGPHVLTPSGYPDDCALSAQFCADGVLASFDPLGEVVWAANFGSTAEDHARGLAVDQDGTLYFAGYFSHGDTDIFGWAFENAGWSDLLFGAMASNGVPLWVQSGASEEGDFAVAAAVSEDALYLAGSTGGAVVVDGQALPFDGSPRSAMVYRLTKEGQVAWSLPLSGDSSEWTERIKLDSAGQLWLLGGTKSQSLDLGTGPLPGGPEVTKDFFVLRLGETGG